MDQYDGIWVCASILHLPKSELKLVLQKMSAALKERGVLYASFQYGEFEGERRGRYFTDFTEVSFGRFIKEIQSLKKADSVDISVSFLMESGMKLLLEELEKALVKGARIRILTGNYLGITQPSALYRYRGK